MNDLILFDGSNFDAGVDVGDDFRIKDLSRISREGHDIPFGFDFVVIFGPESVIGDIGKMRFTDGGGGVVFEKDYILVRDIFLSEDGSDDKG